VLCECRARLARTLPRAARAGAGAARPLGGALDAGLGRPLALVRAARALLLPPRLRAAVAPLQQRGHEHVARVVGHHLRRCRSPQAAVSLALSL